MKRLVKKARRSAATVFPPSAGGEKEKGLPLLRKQWEKGGETRDEMQSKRKWPAEPLGSGSSGSSFKDKTFLSPKQ